MRVPTPSLGERAVVHADFLELLALAANDHNASSADLVACLKRQGWTDEIEDESELEPIAGAAINECRERAAHCGPEAYPFSVDLGLVEVKPGELRLPYVFQLLVTRLGMRCGPKRLPAERMFERLCVCAANEYIGAGGSETRAHHFGTPRDDRTGFETALKHVCDSLLQEGVPKRVIRDHGGDGGVDVVAWRPFPDGGPGKLIAFGQCATGVDAVKTKKVRDLSWSVFQKRFMDDAFGCPPVPMFFVPERLDRAALSECCLGFDGVIFDRCRVAALAVNVPAVLESNMRTWVDHVISNEVRAA